MRRAIAPEMIAGKVGALLMIAKCEQVFNIA
jgi:hypothetical protein